MDPIIDVAAAMERMDGDKDILHELMRIFLEESPRMLADIARALACRDAKALAHAAHSLKGSAATLAAGPVFELARALEASAWGAHFDAVERTWTDLEIETARLRERLAAMLPA